MAKQQPQQQQRRPVQPSTPTQTTPRKPAAAPVRQMATKKASIFSTGSNELIFGKENFIWMGIGLALVLAGLVAMAGGAMPSPDVWDESIIYSFRRITLAPILMVAGFVVVIFGIFKHDKSLDTNELPADTATGA